jgi:hypothetical protein
MSYFVCDVDTNMGKVLKYQKPNPLGEDVYLRPDGTIESDESKIISAQRIFKENYYKAGGPWDLKTREKYAWCSTHKQNSCGETE